MGTDQLRPFLLKSLKSDKFEVAPLAGDASSRRYFRIVAENQSYVLMEWEPFQRKGYPFLSVLEHFHKHKVEVPRVFDMSESEGLVLLEDLGDLTLERKFWENINPSNILPFYKMAIDELIKIHFPATFDRNDCTAFNAEFDHTKLFWEMENAHLHLFTEMLKFNPGAAVEAKVKEELSKIATILANQPKHIAHRDYHSRNLMVRLNKLHVIDFQDARMGALAYDIASLLRDPYVSVTAECEKDLLKYYLEQALQYLKAGFSEAEFYEVYEYQAIQRCFKAVGTFTSMFNKKQDRRYLKHIAPALERVQQSLQKFPALKEFKTALQDSGAMEFRYEKL